jgi:hypothetical protein
MSWNLRALGPIAIAALAIAIVPASAAQAEGAKGILSTGATPSTYQPATLVGKQYGTPGVKNRIKITGFGDERIFTCDEVTFTGTVTDGKATTLTITPDYAKCQVKNNMGTFPVTVFMNGCDYILEQPETVAPLNTGKYEGGMELFCPIGKSIEAKVYFFGNSTMGTHSLLACNVRLFPGAMFGEFQTLEGSVSYTNVPNVDVTGGVKRDDVTMFINTSDFDFFQSGPGCMTQGGNTTEYENQITMQALDDVTDTGKTEHTDHLDVWFDDAP